MQCLAKIDHQVTRQHRYIMELAFNLNLQPGGAGIENGDKTVVCMGPQAPIRCAGVVVHKIQKRCATTL